MKQQIVSGVWVSSSVLALIAASCSAPAGEAGAGAGEEAEGMGIHDDAPELASPAALPCEDPEIEARPPQRLQTAAAARMASLGPGGAPRPQPCVHEVCREGEGLDPACSVCASRVCAVDPSCCFDGWEEPCVRYAKWFCGACGGGDCAELPRGGTCIDDYAVNCERGSIMWVDCWEEDAVCAADELRGRVVCSPP